MARKLQKNVYFSICKPKIRLFFFWIFQKIKKGKSRFLAQNSNIAHFTQIVTNWEFDWFFSKIFRKHLTKLLRRWFMSFYSANCVSPFAAACYCCSPGSQFYFYGLPFSVLHCNTASEQCFFENMIKSQTYQEFWRMIIYWNDHINEKSDFWL